MLKVGFIGAGTVGTALALRLLQKDYQVVSVTSRTRASADRLALAVEGCKAYDSKQAVADTCDIVFITTPDDAIEMVVQEAQWHKSQSVVHCSGSDSLDVLEKVRNDGAQVGAFHPLQTFASVAYAIQNFPGTTFALEAEGQLLDILKGMAGALGGQYVVLKPGDKVLYHAAAVIACNYTVSLMKMATDLWRLFGVSTTESIRALVPLLRGTVNNIENVGLPDCLTGPIARGDTGTISKHLVALGERAPALVPIYRDLGLQTIPISLNKGRISRQKAKELSQLLSGENKPRGEQ